MNQLAGAHETRWIAALAMACGLLGCEDCGTRGMMISNRTAAPVDVIYRRDVGGVETDDEAAHIDANQGITVIGLHQTEGPCLRGTLIAVQDGREIATLSKPCEGTEWVISSSD